VKKILVGNLDSGTTAATIRSLFEPHGAVEKLTLLVGRPSGPARGFALVAMMDLDADRAIAALNGNVVDGRAVEVHEERLILVRQAEG
jgi:RNA recognition motif-containing protein